MGRQAQYKIFIAVLMSLSIVAIHYIGMEALHFYSTADLPQSGALPDRARASSVGGYFSDQSDFCCCGGRISAGAALRRKKQTISSPTVDWPIGQSKIT